MSAPGKAQTAPAAETAHKRHIAVGVDGSAASQAALRWAMREADNHNAEVEAIMCWPTNTWTGMAELFVPADLGVDPQRIVEESVKIVADELNLDVARVRATVLFDAPLPGLLDASLRADALVIGATGHGALGGALLGSVSRGVVAHAACAVVVVPDPEQIARRADHRRLHSHDDVAAPSQAQSWPAMGGTPTQSSHAV